MAFPRPFCSGLSPTRGSSRSRAQATTGRSTAIVERYRRPLLRACRRILSRGARRGCAPAGARGRVDRAAARRRGGELRPWLPTRIVRNTRSTSCGRAGYDLEELVDTLGSSSDPEEEIARRAVVRRTLAGRRRALPERQRDAPAAQPRSTVTARTEVARDLGSPTPRVRAARASCARGRARTATTAAVPLPAAASFASVRARRVEPIAWRIADLLYRGRAGATVTLAKAAPSPVLAGGAVGRRAVVSDAHGRASDARASAQPPPPLSTPREAGGGRALVPRRVRARCSTVLALRPSRSVRVRASRVRGGGSQGTACGRATASASAGKRREDVPR